MNVVNHIWIHGLVPYSAMTWASVDSPYTCTSLDNIHVGYRSMQYNGERHILHRMIYNISVYV